MNPMEDYPQFFDDYEAKVFVREEVEEAVDQLRPGWHTNGSGLIQIESFPLPEYQVAHIESFSDSVELPALDWPEGYSAVQELLYLQDPIAEEYAVSDELLRQLYVDEWQSAVKRCCDYE